MDVSDFGHYKTIRSLNVLALKVIYITARFQKSYVSCGYRRCLTGGLSFSQKLGARTESLSLFLSKRIFQKASEPQQIEK